MTVTTVFATAPGGEGDVDSSDVTYATARTSGSLVATANHSVGQEVFAGTFYCREAFILFDTSGIPDTDTVSGVVLSLDGTTNASTTDFTSTVAASSYNGGVTVTGDWVDGSTLSGLTSLATFGSAGYDAAYMAFTSAGAAFNSAINKTGNTSLIVFSSRHSAGTEPPNSEYITYTDADAAGTTEDPKLDITHAGAAALLSLPVNINQAVNRASTY